MAGRAAAGQPHAWREGDLVERLLDDVSDIWAGATILGSTPDGLYTLAYADNGSIEHEVEGCELRERKMRMDLPIEAWVFVGACLVEKEDLCTFEAVARGTREAHRQHGQDWWCVSYHAHLGSCGPLCRFVRVRGASSLRLAAAAARVCQEEATRLRAEAAAEAAAEELQAGRRPKLKAYRHSSAAEVAAWWRCHQDSCIISHRPAPRLKVAADGPKNWKERYAEQQQEGALRRQQHERWSASSPSSSPGDAAYRHVGLMLVASPSNAACRGKGKSSQQCEFSPAQRRLQSRLAS